MHMCESQQHGADAVNAAWCVWQQHAFANVQALQAGQAAMVMQTPVPRPEVCQGIGVLVWIARGVPFCCICTAG